MQRKKKEVLARMSQVKSLSLASCNDNNVSKYLNMPVTQFEFSFLSLPRSQLKLLPPKLLKVTWTLGL